MAIEYKLSYTANEINNKLGQIDNLSEEISQLSSEIVDIKADVLQQIPLFANSIEECVDTTKMYVLPDGYIYAYQSQEISGGAAYTDLMPTSVDTDGSIYNGVGWKGDVRISGSSGTDKDAAWAAATGFFPMKANDVGRLKYTGSTKIWDVQDQSASSNVIAYYDASKVYLGAVTIQPATYGICTVSDYPTGSVADGGIVTFVAPNHTSIAFARISCASYASSIDGLIITVNEEIKESGTITVHTWTSTGHAFVPADYEDRIIILEKQVSDIVDGTTEVEGSGADEFAFIKPTTSTEELTAMYKKGIRLVVIDKSENLVLTSISKNGVVFNGCGYMTGYRLNSSGAIVSSQHSVLTGFMPYTYGKVIEIVGGLNEANAGGQYIATYNSNFELIRVQYLDTLINSSGGNTTYDNNGVRIHTIKTANFDSTTNKSMFESASYIRVCLTPCIGNKMQVLYN